MKYENTRIVTFKEDYYVRAKGEEKDGKTPRKLLHKKGSRHAMHKGIVDILKRNKAQIDVETLDAKKIEEKMKESVRKKREVNVK